VLRLDPGLHAALRAAAAEAGLSLNDYCARKLAAPLGNLGALEESVRTVQRAAALLGDGLVGVVMFGSVARGDAVASSDVDVLVVVDSSIAITRDLYRAWDQAPIVRDGRRVEPLLVRLPEPTERVAGIWAEVAIDGIVLFDRALRLSFRLAAVRRDIAAGRLVRRLIHGQPYWTEAA